ncbi:MAG: DUF2092 domain-containing protein [Cyclobacteriaceae bacterium]
MKRLLILICALISATLLLAQEDSNSSSRSVDSVAVYLLDNVVAMIGELQSCSYQLTTSVDKVHPTYGLHKEFTDYKVYMSGTDKMLILEEGYDGKWGYWYNGTIFTYYSYNEDNYAIIDAPSNTVAMIDTLHQMYNIEFPAADFFYPTLTDDILNSFDTLWYLGRKHIGEQECFHILATNESMNVQIWLTDDGFTLPLQFVIVYRNQKDSPQYEATFTHWEVNPELPPSLFEFVPPPDARLIATFPKTSN